MAQINLGGSIGVPGSVAILGALTGAQSIIISDSNPGHTLLPSEFSNKFLALTGTLTATRSLIAPLTPGQEFVIQNNTTGGHAVTVGGSTGATVSIPNGVTASVVCDGTNYLQATGSSSGSFTAGGDLSGTSTSQTVIGLQGFPVSATSPTNGQVLEFISGAWNAVTFSASGVSWTGDLLGSADGYQFVTGISGQQVGSIYTTRPGAVNVNAKEFYISNTVPNFTIDWDPPFSAVNNGANGGNINLTAQTGQRGGPGFVSGNGGQINLISGFGGTGGGATPGIPGDIEISLADGSSSLFLQAVPGGIGNAVLSGNGATSIAANSATVAVSPGFTQIQTGLVTGGLDGTTYISNTYDGYTSFIQINGGFPTTNDTLLWFNVASNPSNLADMEFSVNNIQQMHINKNGIQLFQLQGNGSGVVAIDNNGYLSWTGSVPPSGGAGGDLQGSTYPSPFVSSISGGAGAGGTIPINATNLQFYASTAPTNPSAIPINPSILHHPQPNQTTPSTPGTPGGTLTVQAQSGQNAVNNGGGGGSLQLFSGFGGTAVNPGPNGQVTVGDPTGVSCNLTITPPFLIDLGVSSSSGNITTTVSGLQAVSVTASGTQLQGGFQLQQFAVTTTTYTIDTAQPDYYLFCDSSSGGANAPITLTLPATSGFGRTLVIKDIGGFAGTNNITINHHFSEHIDAGTSYTINTNYGAVTLAANGFTWFIVSKI